MDWRDDGIVLSLRKYGESSVVVHLLTREHGRHSGLVRGGNSKKQRGVLQPGNEVHANWRARLEEHLGGYSIELLDHRTASWTFHRSAQTFPCSIGPTRGQVIRSLRGQR